MISPELGFLAAEFMAESAVEAERTILARVSSLLAQGDNLDAIEYQKVQLGNVQKVRATAVEALSSFGSSYTARIEQMIAATYAVGAGSALADLADVAERFASISSPAGQATIRTLAREATARVEDASKFVLRQVQDDYRRVVAEAVEQTALGALNRRQAVQQSLDRLMGRGIKVAPANSRGARMSLPDYVQMATRTAATNAAIEGHSEALLQNGIDLCMIQLGPRNCDVCDGWANRVLSVSGKTSGTVVMPDYGSDSGDVRVKVDGSLPEARSAGWGHPNCRCGVRAFVPGVTKPDPNRRKWDREGYEAQQRQREIERKIREARLRETLALDPEEQARARAEARRWQQRQRDHIDAHPYLKRQPIREQLGKGLGPDEVSFKTRNPAGPSVPVKLVSRESLPEWKRKTATQWGDWRFEENRAARANILLQNEYAPERAIKQIIKNLNAGVDPFTKVSVRGAAFKKWTKPPEGLLPGVAFEYTEEDVKNALLDAAYWLQSQRPQRFDVLFKGLDIASDRIDALLQGGVGSEFNTTFSSFSSMRHIADKYIEKNERRVLVRTRGAQAVPLKDNSSVFGQQESGEALVNGRGRIVAITEEEGVIVVDVDFE